MKFNLKDLNPGVWFDLTAELPKAPDEEQTEEEPEDNQPPEEEQDDDPKPDVGRVCVRLCNGDALDAIDKQTIKQRQVFRKGHIHRLDDIDHEKRSALIWDYCILDWKNIQDENGVDIPCNKDTKRALMAGSPFFCTFIDACLEILRAEIEERTERAEKNS